MQAVALGFCFIAFAFLLADVARRMVRRAWGPLRALAECVALSVLPSIAVMTCMRQYPDGTFLILLGGGMWLTQGQLMLWSVRRISPRLARIGFALVVVGLVVATIGWAFIGLRTCQDAQCGIGMLFVPVVFPIAQALFAVGHLAVRMNTREELLKPAI
jgi:hypothetical protein